MARYTYTRTKSTPRPMTITGLDFQTPGIGAGQSGIVSRPKLNGTGFQHTDIASRGGSLKAVGNVALFDSGPGETRVRGEGEEEARCGGLNPCMLAATEIKIQKKKMRVY